MGWFWSDSPAPSIPPQQTPSKSSRPPCSPSQPSQCPVNHTQQQTSQSSGCPRHASSSSRGLNPRNNMPNLPNEPIIRTTTGQILATERETSTIPMNNQGERWEYPSHQQMFNAIVRKGYDGAPDDVPAMVAVHNWLNEGCWQQILRWEKKYFPYVPMFVKDG
jgi:cytochrome c heme-lyase